MPNSKNDDTAIHHWSLLACCLVAFARLGEPQLWMMGLDRPASTPALLVKT